MFRSFFKRLFNQIVIDLNSDQGYKNHFKKTPGMNQDIRVIYERIRTAISQNAQSTLKRHVDEPLLSQLMKLPKTFSTFELYRFQILKAEGNILRDTWRGQCAVRVRGQHLVYTDKSKSRLLRKEPFDQLLYFHLNLREPESGKTVGVTKDHERDWKLFSLQPMPKDGPHLLSPAITFQLWKWKYLITAWPQRLFMRLGKLYGRRLSK